MRFVSSVVRSFVKNVTNPSPLTYKNGMRLCQASTAAASQATSSSEPFPLPPADGAHRKVSAKIERLVEEIANLSLIEVADLNDLLKRRLNLPDAPMMPAGAMMAAGPAKEEEEEDIPIVKKTSYTVKLLSYDDSKKIALIKEVKALIPSLNLVQAKKFVESVPQVLKADIGKDEADKLKETLAAIGAECEIE